MMEALDTALEMPIAEREARALKDLSHLRSNTSEDWGRRFLVDLKSQKKKQEEHWMAVGFGLASFRMVGMGADFNALDTQQVAAAYRRLPTLPAPARPRPPPPTPSPHPPPQVVTAYRRSAHRCIMLDWGGTLMPADTGFYDERDSEKFEVPENVLELLRSLCADPANHVMILSGLGRDKVQQAFGSVPNLCLAVEHGFHFRIKSGAWQQLLPGVNTSWREVAEAVVRVYATRTNGSYMQRKGSSIVWNYTDADPEFGQMQARELQYHLQGVLAAFPVVVRSGKGYVEACPKGIDKGTMAERLIDIASADDARGPSNTPVQFVLCIGDDSSDELMFSALHAKLGLKPADIDLFTCTVGRKPSEASSYLGDHTEARALPS